MRHIGRIVMTMKNMAIIRFAGADTSTQPFHYLKLGADGGISGNSNVRGTVASSYKLFMAIGVIGLLTTLIIVAIKIGDHRYHFICDSDDFGLFNANCNCICVMNGVKRERR